MYLYHSLQTSPALTNPPPPTSSRQNSSPSHQKNISLASGYLPTVERYYRLHSDTVHSPRFSIAVWREENVFSTISTEQWSSHVDTPIPGAATGAVRTAIRTAVCATIPIPSTTVCLPWILQPTHISQSTRVRSPVAVSWPIGTRQPTRSKPQPKRATQAWVDVAPMHPVSFMFEWKGRKEAECLNLSNRKKNITRWFEVDL